MRTGDGMKALIFMGGKIWFPSTPREHLLRQPLAGGAAGARGRRGVEQGATRRGIPARPSPPPGRSPDPQRPLRAAAVFGAGAYFLMKHDLRSSGRMFRQNMGVMREWLEEAGKAAEKEAKKLPGPKDGKPPGSS